MKGGMLTVDSLSVSQWGPQEKMRTTLISLLLHTPRGPCSEDLTDLMNRGGKSHRNSSALLSLLPAPPASCSPVRPRSSIARDLSGSGSCVRSCESPGWWSWVPPPPGIQPRCPAPSVPRPAGASSSGPAPPTRTCHTNRTRLRKDVWLRGALSSFNQNKQTDLKRTKQQRYFAYMWRTAY